MSRNKFFSRAIPALMFFLIAATNPVIAQSPAAAQANLRAYDLYLAGNYEEAAAAYEQVLKDFPTDLLVPIMTVQLGFSYFFIGEFDKSLALLEKARVDPTTPPDLLPVIVSFIPQVLAAKASALPPDDPGRTKAFEDAIAKFGEYLKEFPTGVQAETVTYGRALANYQIGRFDETVQDLEENLKKHAASPTILESQNLLAISFATLGSKELSDSAGGDRAKGIALYGKAKQLLQEIIDKKTNLTLVNDARFQLAEILFSEAAFAPEEERPAIYSKAMEAYRQVAPNEEMISLQQEKLAGMPERRRRVLLSRNQAAISAFDREVEREQRRLGELMAKPDMISTSGLKMSEIYFHDGDLDKSRVVLRHITPFLTKDEDKKRALYFLTMTYALQNVADKAVESYNAFQSEYKADPMAQNLPLAVGSLFLNHPDPSVRSPEKAIEYFDESLEIYPEGQLVGMTTVNKAGAQTRLGQVAEAEATFTKFLEGAHSPDEDLTARMGLSDLYRMTSQWDKTIATYQTVLDKYPERPQATVAQFWIAVATQQKGDNAAAIPLLEKALADHPTDNFVPFAKNSLAESLIATGETEKGIQTLADLAESHPDSPPAPFSFFRRAQIFGKDGKVDEVNAMMREFIEKYPTHERIFFAYDTLAQNAYRTAQWEEAINFYREFSEKYADDPKGPDAVLKVAEFSRQWAESLGRYTALTTDERSLWSERVDASVEAAEQMIGKYPDSAQLALGVQTLIASQQLLLGADLRKPEEVEEYISALAEAAPSEEVKSKILFGLASWISEQDKDRALAIMSDAFNPSVKYAPADLDTYGLALLAKEKVDEAETVFAKLSADYPVPDAANPQGAPPEIQQAQAIALFGKAKIAQERGETAEAGELFAQLKKLYGWSPKVLEAELGIAEANFAAGKLDEAIGRLPAVIRAPNATADLRAKAMLLGGHIMKQRSENAKEPKARDEAVASAIDYYIKIDQFYSGVPTIAGEGLFEGAQMLEKQAAASQDVAFKQKQLDLAKRCYQDILNKYPNSAFVEKTKERLKSLGVP